MGNPETQIPEDEMPQVDEQKIRRNSILSGAWNGMKKGMFWGGVGTAVLTAAALFIGVPKAMAMGKGIASTLVSLPGPIGWAFAGILGVAGIAAGAATINMGIGGIAFGLLTDGLKAAATVGIPLLAAGAIIGGVIGAVKGYQGADEDIEAEKRQVERQFKQKQLEKQQAMARQQKLQRAEDAFNRQTEELQTGNMSPDFTPPVNKNNGLEQGAGPGFGD